MLAAKGMEGFDSIDLSRWLAAGLHALTALVWATLAQGFWRARGTARPQGTLMGLVRVVGALFAVQYGLSVMLDLMPAESWDGSDWFFVTVCALTALTTVAVLPVLRHLIPLGTLGGRPPGRGWLAVNYGSAVVAAVGVTGAVPGTESSASVIHVYLALMTLLILWEAGRLARGRWRPVFMADLRLPGFMILALVLFAGVLAIVVLERSGPTRGLAWAATHSLVGLTLAAPFALRILGEVMRRFLVTAVRLTVAVAIYLGVHALTESITSAPIALLADLGAVLALVVILGPGGQWLRATVDRVVLHQSHRWGERLQGFLQTLSPELGIAECCRRSAREVAEGLRLRGAGILLDEGSAAHVHGRLDLESITGVWPRAAELPDRAFDLLWLRDVAVQKELYEAGVTWVVPIVSHQKRWGHLFVAAGPLGTAAGDAKLENLESFAQQLALVLDGADLLGRAVAVERDLAQAEKLAALGETAARIAHEIRNPVTAARSLAQLLADEPTSPLNAEHAQLITRELDRVERQVKSLLEFARRETYCFEPVRLAQLAGATVADLRRSLADGVEVRLETGAEVTVRADPERLRQVLINLVMNAVDALGQTPPPRRVEVSVAAANGDAMLAVADSGSGVSDEMLPRLFEPFVSQKTQGTGLGLAIAKRIVEAHDGRIEAEPGPRRGMVFRVWLPALEPALLKQAV